MLKNDKLGCSKIYFIVVTLIQWKNVNGNIPNLGLEAWLEFSKEFSCYIHVTARRFSRIVYPKDLNFIAKKLVLLKSEVEGNSHFCRARKEFGRILLKHTNIRMKDFLLIGGYFSFSQKYLLAR